MGNPITNTLPESLDSFLQDMAQMYCDIDYVDISNFAVRSTPEDLNELKKLRRGFRTAVEYGDEEGMESIANKVEKLIRSKTKIQPDDWNDIYNNFVESVVDMYDGDPEIIDDQAIYEDMAMTVDHFEGDPEDLKDWIYDHMDPEDYLPEEGEDLEESKKSNKKKIEESEEEESLAFRLGKKSGREGLHSNPYGFGEEDSDDFCDWEAGYIAGEQEGNPYILGNCSLCGSHPTETVEHFLTKYGFDDIDYCCDILDIDPLEEVCEECFKSWLPELNDKVYSEYDEFGVDVRTGEPFGEPYEEED